MNPFKSRNIDATTGNLWKQIFLYAIPLIVATVIQNLFNSIDLMVLGNMADSNAIASVGATTSITSLVINSFIGISNGSKIILAHQFGAKNEDMLKRTVDTALLTAFGLGILIATLAIPFAPRILTLTNCPAECFEGAVTYIRIYVAAAPAILVYNFGSAILAASGDTQRPLYYIMICGLTKVILNIILCLILPHKVTAVAISTVITQLTAATLVIRRLCRVKGSVQLVLRSMRFHLRSFGQIMAQGLPLALNSALYPFSTLQIQSAINSFGVSAISGNSTCVTLEAIPDSISSAITSTCTVFMAQNLGANNTDRTKKSFRNCMCLNVGIGLSLGLGLYFSGRFLLRLFLPNDPLAIEYGMIRMFYISFCCNAIYCTRNILASAIQAYGHASFTAFSSIIWICGFRFFWMYVVYPHFETFEMLMLCFIVSATLVTITNLLGYLHFKKNQKSLAGK